MTPEDKAFIMKRIDNLLKETNNMAEVLRRCINKVYTTAPNCLPDDILDTISKISFAAFDCRSAVNDLKIKLKAE